ncbi:hypothetical protein Ais01nite_60750 [Asanoa ishikariensis]|uniref:Uncharacterized protein n=1 Tax=Asanoa ishikariensis TaxID=137265 RepID=A0A1H3P8D2_9ACTN|nr:hypothetical protein [Asanoa ishikariensis]GIF68040.1 hypothetical protein Ais01nite_60750 [Asanoa ishikariensis]SDY97193.1 hypothetical protein SAMN05421684_2653 [Asanoa ishikariensis]
MAKERALRRAAREAEAAKQRARRARIVARRQRRRALLTRLMPRRRRTGRLLVRRSRGQRAGIAVVTLVLLALVWFLVDDIALRLVLTLLGLLCLPALVVVALGRRTS